MENSRVIRGTPVSFSETGVTIDQQFISAHGPIHQWNLVSEYLGLNFRVEQLGSVTVIIRGPDGAKGIVTHIDAGGRCLQTGYQIGHYLEKWGLLC